MDISKLPILIANPAKQAEENLYKNKEMDLVCWATGISNFHDIKVNHDFFKVLMIIFKWPNMNEGHIYANDRVYPLNGFLNLAVAAKLITNIPPKSYKGNNPGYRITKLGIAFLKQNGLID